jgi:hypothetical protein
MQNGDTFAVGLLEEVPKVTDRLSAVNGFQVEEAEEEYQLDSFPLPDMLMLMPYKYDADVDTDCCTMYVVEDNSEVVAGMMITNHSPPHLLYHPKVLTHTLPSNKRGDGQEASVARSGHRTVK